MSTLAPNPVAAAESLHTPEIYAQRTRAAKRLHRRLQRVLGVKLSLNEPLFSRAKTRWGISAGGEDMSEALRLKLEACPEIRMCCVHYAAEFRTSYGWFALAQ